jgi:hypothetical protein
MSPEEQAREDARKLAEFHFPRSRHAREALESDVFLLLAKHIKKAFADGLQTGLGQSGTELYVELDQREARALEDAKDG